MSTRQATLDRHNTLAKACADMKRALDAIGTIRTVDFARGSFVQLYDELGKLDAVHRTLASLLHPSSTELKPNQPTKGD